VKGLEYLVSFGIGSALSTVFLYWAYYAYRAATGRPMPPWHLDVAAKPALLTGLLWSAGNVSSILAIQHLGLAVGWPLVQCQLIVSTVWGIFYYREVTGAAPVGMFFISALVVLSGVVILGKYGM
jgi:hypothetical protein